MGSRIGSVGGGISETSADSRYVNISGDTSTGDQIAPDFVKTRSGSLTRSGDLISSVTKTGGRTLTFTRDGNNLISTISDGTRTWTLTRNGSNQITSWAVS